MNVIDNLRAVIEPSVENMGYELVLLRLSDGNRKSTLTIMAERKDGTGMMIEDCETISRSVSALLDVEDPIAGNYDLEVSSPGIDRPLTRLKDFTNYTGHEIKLETQLPIDGRKRFRGFILERQDNTIYLNVAGYNERQPVAFENIYSAKLVLTERLIKEHTTAANTVA